MSIGKFSVRRNLISVCCSALENMNEIRNTPNMNAELFKFQFNQRVVQPVISNPNILSKNYWTNGR